MKSRALKTMQKKPYFTVNKPSLCFKQDEFVGKERLFCHATKPYLQRSNAQFAPKPHQTNTKAPFHALKNSSLPHSNHNFFAPQNAYICSIEISLFEHIRVSAATRKVSTRTPTRLQFFFNGQKNETFLARKRPYSKKLYYFCRTKNKPAAPRGDTPSKDFRTACGGLRSEST